MSEELAAQEPGAAPRRTLLLGAGVAGVTAVLAACGTDAGDSGGLGAQASTSGTAPSGPDGGGDGGGGTGSNAGGTSGGGTKLGAAAEIPVGGGTVFTSKGVVVTQPAKGTFKCFSAICTHAGCQLTAVDGGTINCGCHGSRFSIEDGSVEEGPAKKALAEKTVTKEGDDIVLT